MLTMLRPRDRFWITLLPLLAALALSVGAAAPPAAASNAAMVISFEKSWIEPGHYLGETGDGGTIEMWVYDVSFVGNVQTFTVTLQLSLGGGSLTAILDGQFNFSTGRVVLNGQVVDGWLTGAQVHEESRFTGIDPETGGPTFAGTVQLMPASAGGEG
jgi:hypothetical protein